MKREKFTLPILALSVFLIPVLIGGCGSERDTAPPEMWGRPRTSPENVLDNLRRAIVERDSLHYAAQLADSFTFVFAPQDTGGPDNIPETWDRTNDILAMNRLFGGKPNRDGYVCQSIIPTWSVLPRDTTPEFPAWTRIRAVNVFITVESYHGATGDPLSYRVEANQEDFWLQKVGSQWSLARWEDKPIVGGGTFGAIKVLWR